MPIKGKHPRPWIERKLPDGSRVFEGQASDDDGVIWFLANGKVAIVVGGQAFQTQKKKVIGRFKADPRLLDVVEDSLQPPFDDRLYELLQRITQMSDQAQFDRHIDAFVSTLGAIRELRRFETLTGRRFIDALHALAIKLQRPPTKAKITNDLCCELSQTSNWCRDHGFGWLPNAPAGRK